MTIITDKNTLKKYIEAGLWKIDSDPEKQYKRLNNNVREITGQAKVKSKEKFIPVTFQISGYYINIIR